MNILVEVTQADIDNGIIGSCELCPIALAITRHLNTDKSYIHVGKQDVIFWNKNMVDKGISRILPKAVQHFIWNFDRTLWPVAPFKFMIDNVPEWALLKKE